MKTLAETEKQTRSSLEMALLEARRAAKAGNMIELASSLNLARRRANILGRSLAQEGLSAKQEKDLKNEALENGIHTQMELAKKWSETHGSLKVVQKINLAQKYADELKVSLVSMGYTKKLIHELLFLSHKNDLNSTLEELRKLAEQGKDDRFVQVLGGLNRHTNSLKDKGFRIVTPDTNKKIANYRSVLIKKVIVLHVQETLKQLESDTAIYSLGSGRTFRYAESVSQYFWSRMYEVKSLATKFGCRIQQQVPGATIKRLRAAARKHNIVECKRLTKMLCGTKNVDNRATKLSRTGLSL